MSNWTELKRLESRVAILENDVAELKRKKQKARKEPQEVPCGAFIPLPEVDMRKGKNRIDAPIAMRFPDGTKKRINGWKAMVLEIAAYENESPRVLSVLKMSGNDRHGNYENALRFARDGHGEDQYTIAFAADSDAYTNDSVQS